MGTDRTPEADEGRNRSVGPVCRGPAIVVGRRQHPVLLVAPCGSRPSWRPSRLARAIQPGRWTRCPALVGTARPGRCHQRHCRFARARSGRGRAPRQRGCSGPTGCRCRACSGWRSPRRRWLQHQGADHRVHQPRTGTAERLPKDGPSVNPVTLRCASEHLTQNAAHGTANSASSMSSVYMDADEGRSPPASACGEARVAGR